LVFSCAFSVSLSLLYYSSIDLVCYFNYADVPSVLTDQSLPLHIEFIPAEPQLEEQMSALLTQCRRILTETNAPDSKIAALRKTLKQNVSTRRKRKACRKLKREISTALQTDGRIPQKVINPMTKLLLVWTKADIDLINNEPHSSIILCLKCGSVRSLLRLKQMVLSGYLLRLLSDAIEQFIQHRPRIQLVIQAEDYNSCLSYLSNIARKFVSCSVTL